jgi:cell division septation protein DedD
VAAPTPAPAPAPADRGSYTLNLSAYASAANATALQRRVQALGYGASSRQLNQAGKQLTQVVAGPFETRTAAEAARLKIAQTVPGVQPRVEQDAGHATAAVPATRAAKATASAPVASRAGGWAVQLAALGSQADANALRDKLRANGFDGYVNPVQSAGRQLWQVRAGPQTQRADAQRVHDQIKAKLGIDGVVRQVP